MCDIFMTVPRVTTVLKPYSGFVHVDTKILERACERGTKVHALCSAIAGGAWVDIDGVEETLRGYVNSFRLWYDGFVDSVVVNEERYIHADLQYSGQVDLVVIAKDKQMYLVDLKTSAKPQKTYKVQAGAYRMLLDQQELPVQACLIVYLNKEGFAPNVDTMIKTDAEERAFKCALECWYYFNNKPEKN